MQINLDHFPNLCVNVLFSGSSQVFDNPEGKGNTKHSSSDVKKKKNLNFLGFSHQDHHISLVQHLNLSLLSSSRAPHCLPRETSLCTGTSAAMSESHQLYSGDRTHVGLRLMR